MKIQGLRGPAAIALLALGAACTRDPQAAFTRDVADRAKSSVKDVDVEVVAPLQLAVTPKGGKRTLLDLGDLWRTCGSKASCGAPVDAYLRSVVARSLVVEIPARREFVRPRVRFASRRTLAEASAVSERIAGDLVVFYMLESPAGSRPLASADAEELGMDAAALRAAAVANLEAVAGDIPYEHTQDAAGVFLVRSDSIPAGACLLLTSRWTKAKAEVRGELVVGVPHEDVLYFTGTGEDDKPVDRMRDLESQQVDGAAGTLLRWTPEGFVPFTR